ncbi:hypothetical protein [Frankia sp. Cr2]|uniref:hypothetical protein n=1 Tax=Frankia sp. Cr2 TaxID=3073932 RepID=UPI002AD36002|nr:hypothetical protein [Frankia sp. Cr2]
MDESLRLRVGETGLYILAAAVADVSSCPPIRDSLRSLLGRRQQRLHWRDEDAPRRRKVVSLVAGADLVAVVVVGAPVDRRKQERARRICMERLMYELGEMSVARVLLESRTSSLNSKDLAMVEALRGSRIMPTGLYVGHASPLAEPMLWIADAVAGAVSAARDGQHEFVTDLRHLVMTIETTVR